MVERPMRTNDTPVEWRELLVEVLFEAERKGLGRVHVGFTATEGMADQAAEFIGARCAHLSEMKMS